MKRHDALGWAAIWSARLYRALLLAFPAPFRRAYGDEMARTFRDLCREAWRTGGTGGVLALWPGALRDLLLAASAEHVGGLTMLRLTLILSLAALVLFALDTLVELVWPVPSGDPPDFMTNVAIYGFVAWLGLAVVVWLLGAFVAARRGRWGWFALALCLPYAGSLVYSVLGPVAAPRVARAQDAEFERRNAASNIDPAALEQGMVIMTRWVLILSLAAPGLYILDYIIYYAGAFFIPPGEEFATYDQIMGYTVLIPAIASVCAWLLGIVDTLRRGMWGWFVLVLLVPVLGSLIYSAVTLRAHQPDIAQHQLAVRNERGLVVPMFAAGVGAAYRELAPLCPFCPQVSCCLLGSGGLALHLSDGEVTQVAGKHAPADIALQPHQAMRAAARMAVAAPQAVEWMRPSIPARQRQRGVLACLSAHPVDLLESLLGAADAAAEDVADASEGLVDQWLVASGLARWIR